MLGQTILRFSVFVSLLVSFIAMSQYRLAAGDEGFYVMAAKLVLGGSNLYTDFFYPQMPLLPVAYSWWMSISEVSWESARIFSAFISSLLGLLLFIRMQELFNRPVALIGAILFATSSMVLAWYCTIKTFALSTLFLFGCYHLLASRSKSLDPYKIFGAGILFGLSVETRLFFAGLLPLFLYHLWNCPGNYGHRVRLLGSFTLGAFIAMLPSVYYIFTNFENYYFNNLGYHLIRSDRNFLASLTPKFTIFKSVLGLRATDQFSGAQLPLFIWLTFLGMIIARNRQEPRDLALAITAFLFILSLLPTPSYIQYFSTLVPFALIGSFITLRSIHRTLASSRYARFSILFSLTSATLLVWHFSATLMDIEKYTKSGIGVIGVGPANASNKTPQALREISDLVDQNITPGDIVLSEWPGFLMNSHATVYPGLENHFGYGVGQKLSEDKRRRYKILSRPEIARIIRKGNAPYVLLEQKSFDRLHKNNLGLYNEIFRHNGVLFFKRKV